MLLLAIIRGFSAEDSVSDRFNLFDTVHLDHNRPKVLTEEVNSLEVQNVLLRKASLTTPPAFLSKLQLEVVFHLPEEIRTEVKDKSENEQDAWLQFELGGAELKWPSAAIKASVPESYKNALNDYLNMRLSGHTKSYAVDSIQKRRIRPTAGDMSLVILRRAHPDVPFSWVKRATRRISSIAQPGDIEYHVVDGPVVWVFVVSTQQNMVRNVVLVDAQATDQTLAPKFKEADQEARSRLEQRGLKPRLGYCHAYWPELKKVLKEKFEITWYSPAQLNPASNYD